MNATRWRQINEVFHAVLECAPADRAAYLERATTDDPDLRREVESLLASHARSASDRFLEVPAWGVGADLLIDDDDEPAPLSGRTIGHYVVHERVGSGGMGVVYAAWDTKLGRPVALKALPDEYASDPARRKRLKHEAKAAAKLAHPAVATVYAFEEFDDAAYIVSELVRGQTLRDELRNGPLPTERLLHTLIDIASGLAAAHALGIVHRDLKPENIKRRTDGQIKLLDFGLATTDPAHGAPTRTRLTEVGTTVGTPGYMAPEQLKNGTADARSDVFAFGVLAWELATAEHPFGSDPATLFARAVEGRSGVVSRSLPIPVLDPIVRRCLRLSPDDRYQSAETLLQALRAIHIDDLRVPRAAEPQPVGTPRAVAWWWWQFHQGTVGVLNALTPVLAWFVRGWAPRPYGTVLFYTVLVLATVSATLRFNLMFISRVDPSSVPAHRKRLAPWVTVAEALLATGLLAAAASVAGPHDAMAAVLVSFAIATIASLGIIEPATTSAAGMQAPAATSTRR